MEKVLDQSITTRLSLAVSLLDDFTKRKEIIGNVSVSIPALNIDAIRNPSGFYIFLDIPVDNYTLEIKSDNYLDEKVDISLPHLTLRNPLRFDHASGVPLRKMIPSSSTRAQVADNGAPVGDISILLNNISGTIQERDVFMIADTDLSRIEFCQIDSPVPGDPDADPFYLTLPLRFSHSKGTFLKKIIPDLIIAKINGGLAGVITDDKELSLTNITEAINVNDVLTVDDGIHSEPLQVAAPLSEYILAPDYRYLFPSSTTLISGTVKSLDGASIADAAIEVLGESFNTRTAKNGEFVIYFPPSRENSSIQIVVTTSDGISTIVDSEIVKGKKTSLPLIEI